jgi:hypothetical protein
MPTIRGRAIKVGGMATDGQGATARVDPVSQQTRPAFRSAAQIFQPTGGAGGRGFGAVGPLLDPSTVAFWRLLAVALALAYIIGFHVTLGRVKIGISGRG